MQGNHTQSSIGVRYLHLVCCVFRKFPESCDEGVWREITGAVAVQFVELKRAELSHRSRECWLFHEPAYLMWARPLPIGAQTYRASVSTGAF